MYVTWNDKKALTNLKKHGVDFVEAATALSDPSAVTFEDKNSSEERFITIGYSVRINLLVVITCYRDENEIRIISARKATKKERLTYEEGI